MIFTAKDYLKRADLDEAIKIEVGGTVDEKTKHTIEGTMEELQRLGLSPKTRIWGVKCVGSDYVKKKATPMSEVPNRGELHDFGINQRNNKPK